MIVEDSSGHPVRVTVFDDVTSDERVFEFRKAGVGTAGEAFAAVVVPESGRWADAVVSISPRVSDIPVQLMVWLIEVARRQVEESK